MLLFLEDKFIVTGLIVLNFVSLDETHAFCQANQGSHKRLFIFLTDNSAFEGQVMSILHVLRLIQLISKDFLTIQQDTPLFSILIIIIHQFFTDLV